jgi:hypothetical protein
MASGGVVVGRNQKAPAAAAATPRSHYIESLLDPDEIVIDGK